MAKEQKKVSNNLVIGLIGLVVIVFSGVGIAFAVGESIINNFYGDTTVNQSGGQELSLGVFDDGDVSNMTDLDIEDELRIQDLTYGSRYYEALNFSAGNTTTPGKLVSIENTGDTKICSRVELNISTGSTLGGLTGAGSAYTFSISTSTTAINGGVVTANLIASSTVATSTIDLLDSVVDEGTGVSVPGQSFVWTENEFINGQFDIADNQAAASSTAYTSMVGGLYITCHTQ